MKHLKKFENNIEDDNLYLIHWGGDIDGEGEGYEVVSEGYLQRNSDRISESGDEDLKLVEHILNLEVDESVYGDGDGQKLNGYIGSITKITYRYQPIDPNFEIKMYGKKYNL